MAIVDADVDSINGGSTCLVGLCDDPRIFESIPEIRSLISKVCAVWRTVLLPVRVVQTAGAKVKYSFRLISALCVCR